MAVVIQRKPTRKRLTQPLVRDSKGLLRPVSWDDALQRAAELFARVKSVYGPDGLGVFSCSKSSNELNYLASKFARVAFGTHNIDSCNRT